MFGCSGCDFAGARKAPREGSLCLQGWGSTGLTVLVPITFGCPTGLLAASLLFPGSIPTFSLLPEHPCSFPGSIPAFSPFLAASLLFSGSIPAFPGVSLLLPRQHHSLFLPPSSIPAPSPAASQPCTLPWQHPCSLPWSPPRPSLCPLVQQSPAAPSVCAQGPSSALVLRDLQQNKIRGLKKNTYVYKRSMFALTQLLSQSCSGRLGAPGRSACPQPSAWESCWEAGEGA